MEQLQSFGILNKGSGLRPSGFTRQATSARLAGDVIIQVWINSSPSNRCISHFQAQLTHLLFIQHLKCTYWIKGILCGYAIRSGRHPSGSQRPGPLTSLGMSAWPYRVTTKYSYCIYICIHVYGYMNMQIICLSCPPTIWFRGFKWQQIRNVLGRRYYF